MDRLTTETSLFKGRDEALEANLCKAIDALRAEMDRVIEEMITHMDDASVPALLADALVEDPLEAETLLRDYLFKLGRVVTGRAIEEIDRRFPSVIEVDGKSYHRVTPTSKTYASLFGHISAKRSRYRPSGLGDAIVPTERILAIGDIAATVASEKMITLLASRVSHREARDTLMRLIGDCFAVSSMGRFAAQADETLGGTLEEDMEAIRDEEIIPDVAHSVMVSLDGVMLPMREETRGEAHRLAGWREASTGTVFLLDKDGEVLTQRYVGRLPEPNKQSLKRLLTDEVESLRKRRPDLRVIAIADAAVDNWTWLETLDPGVSLIDAWHAFAHLKECANDAFGEGTEASDAWYKKYRDILRDAQGGIERVIEAIRYLASSGRGGRIVKRELAFFRKNRPRMDYHGAQMSGSPIGSGCVEAANKVLVQQRMKLAGQRWGRAGGQGILTTRAFDKSGRYDAAFRHIVNKRKAHLPSYTPRYNLQTNLAA